MVDPSIHDTAAYRIIEDDWLKETTVGLDYCYDICLQCDQEILDRCYKENYGYIWKNLMYDPERF